MSQLSKYLRIAIVALEDAEMECTVDGMKPQKAYEQVHRQIVDLLANLNLIRDKIVSEIEKE